MIEDDAGIGKSAGEIGEFADLRMEEPGIEGEAERRKMSKPLAKVRIAQQALRPRRIHAGDIGVCIPRRGMPDAAKAAVAGRDLGFEHGARTVAEP